MLLFLSVLQEKKLSNGLITSSGISRLLPEIFDKLTEILGSNAWKTKCDNIIDVTWLSILDSIQLMVFHRWLEQRLNKELHPSFLFSYTTPRTVVDQIEETNVPSARPRTRVSNVRNREDIAIVAMSCRFPGDVSDLHDLWDVLKNKKDLTGYAPWSRWDSDYIVAKLNRENGEAIERIHFGAFLSEEVMESFDYKFFGISVNEAYHMSPSHRLLLTCAQEALREAGYKTEDLRGRRVSVFVGISHMVDDEAFNEKKTQEGWSVGVRSNWYLPSCCIWSNFIHI